MNLNCYRLSCISWALAQISCYWPRNTGWKSLRYSVTVHLATCMTQTQQLMHAEYKQQNSLLLQITAKESRLQECIYVQCLVPVIQNTIHHHQAVTSWMMSKTKDLQRARSCVDCKSSTSDISVDMRPYRYHVLCLSLVRVDQTPPTARKLVYIPVWQNICWSVLQHFLYI